MPVKAHGSYLRLTAGCDASRYPTPRLCHGSSRLWSGPCLGGPNSPWLEQEFPLLVRPLHHYYGMNPIASSLPSVTFLLSHKALAGKQGPPRSRRRAWVLSTRGARPPLTLSVRPVLPSTAASALPIMELTMLNSLSHTHRYRRFADTLTMPTHGSRRNVDGSSFRFSGLSPLSAPGAQSPLPPVARRRPPFPQWRNRSRGTRWAS